MIKKFGMYVVFFLIGALVALDWCKTELTDATDTNVTLETQLADTRTELTDLHVELADAYAEAHMAYTRYADLKAFYALAPCK